MIFFRKASGKNNDPGTKLFHKNALLLKIYQFKDDFVLKKR